MRRYANDRQAQRVRRNSALRQSHCHHIEEVADGRFDQLLGVIGRCLTEAAPHHHSVSIADTTVTGRAVDVEARLAAKQIGSGDGEWKFSNVHTVLFAGVAGLVDAQVAACDGSLDDGPRRSPVPKKASASQRFVAWLVVHVLPAPDHGQ